MQKYKQVNVSHPEDVGPHRKIMSDPPQEKQPSHVFRGNLWPIVAVVLVILAIAVCMLPWPTHIQCTVPAARLNEDGSFLENGEIVIDAWMYNYLFRSDEFYVNELRLPGDETDIIIRSISTNFGYFETLDLYYAHFQTWTQSAKSQSIADGVLNFSGDRCNWIIELNDKVFIGATEENADYAKLLDKFGWMIE